MKKPHNQVVLRLPFRIGGLISFRVRRKIGFLFNNYVPHMVFIASGAKDGKEFEEWSKMDNGELRNFEFLYQAAVNYNNTLRIKDKFTRVSLKRALNEASPEQVKILTDCIQRSEMYGATYKKKVHRKKSK